jgi:hypothetical protein
MRDNTIFAPSFAYHGTNFLMERLSDVDIPSRLSWFYATESGRIGVVASHLRTDFRRLYTSRPLPGRVNRQAATENASAAKIVGVKKLVAAS